MFLLENGVFNVPSMIAQNFLLHSVTFRVTVRV